MNTRTPLTNRFKQLRWKLTLSYTGVTVGALLTLEFILLGALGIWLIVLLNSGALPRQLIESGAQFTPAFRTYLSQTPPDQEGIAELLAWVRTATSPTIPLSFDATDELLVVGSDGTLLGSSPTDLLGNDMIGQPLNPQAIPGLAAPLQAALAGTEDIQRLYTLEKPGGKVVMAIPVWDADHRQVLGAMIGMAEVPTAWSTLGELVPILGVSLLIFTVIAGLTGTPFGYLAARGLVHRFDGLAEATLAWSQGDFSVLVDDTSGDELGQLARRLNSMAEQLQNLLNTRQDLAVVEERNRLARDLHDSVKQQAFAASAQIGAARALLKDDPQAAASHLVEAEQLAYELRQELTGLIDELRPVALADKGLTSALRNYSSDWSRQNDISLDMRVQGQRSLPLDTEQTIFRIAQETLANIARHSHASHVDIQLAYTRDNISCTITDNGRGFDTNKKNSGFGLHSMQERASSLNASLTIESEIGQQTRLTLSVPLNQPQHNHEDDS